MSCVAIVFATALCDFLLLWDALKTMWQIFYEKKPFIFHIEFIIPHFKLNRIVHPYGVTCPPFVSTNFANHNNASGLPSVYTQMQRGFEVRISSRTRRGILLDKTMAFAWIVKHYDYYVILSSLCKIKLGWRDKLNTSVSAIPTLGQD